MHLSDLSSRRCDTISDMKHGARTWIFLALGVIVCVGASTLLPPTSMADTTAPSMSTAADAMCHPWIPQCGCNQVPTATGCAQSKNTYKCPVGVCSDTTNGFKTQGVCIASGVCQAVLVQNLQGQSGGVDTGLQQLGQTLGQLLQQLMQGGSSGSGSTGGSSTTTTCPNGYYTVTTPSSDPCAQYVAPTSSSIDTTSTTGSTAADALLQALGGSTDTSGGVTITNDNSNTNTNANPTTSLNLLTQSTSSVFAPGSAASVLLSPLVGGASGNIQLSSNGATVIGGTTDLQSNTTVAGFYGSDTFGGQQPQSLAASLCESRPWATNFLSAIVSPSFFDSLCTWQGYQVGATPAQTPVLQQTTFSGTQSAPVPATTTIPTVAPQATIWAVPASVPLDTRTSIFWNTQGVSNCTETSPDGSFSQSSLSGGASTVPITGATTFTISCLAPNGTPVTNFVTVNLSI